MTRTLTLLLTIALWAHYTGSKTGADSGTGMPIHSVSYSVPQDVDVIPITLEESVRAKTAHDTLLAAQVQWDSLNIYLMHKYVTVPCQAPGSGAPLGPGVCSREGFDNGFKFTRDYKTLIPDAVPLATGLFNCWKIRR